MEFVSDPTFHAEQRGWMDHKMDFRKIVKPDIITVKFHVYAPTFSNFIERMGWPQIQKSTEWGAYRKFWERLGGLIFGAALDTRGDNTRNFTVFM